MLKRQRTTPSEKIKAWMASAEFRIRPDPDVELGFPAVRTVYAGNIETPRLGGRSNRLCIEHRGVVAVLF